VVFQPRFQRRHPADTRKHWLAELSATAARRLLPAAANPDHFAPDEFDKFNLTGHREFQQVEAEHEQLEDVEDNPALLRQRSRLFYKIPRLTLLFV
jgi:hypothetical protein